MTDISTYKERLVAEKTALEAELMTVGQPNPLHTTEWEGVQKENSQESDPNDRADLLDQYQENRAIADVLNARYQEVLAALNRIEQGTYGVCEVSGEPIEEDRLEADPAARTSKANIS